MKESIDSGQAKEELTEEEVKNGNLVLHTIKVWVDHRGETSLAVDKSKKTILDLVHRGEVVGHRLDGASVWDRDSVGRSICTDPDPPKALEKLQEEY
tara:strand:+ start:47 stop:337 length:291 start_codon:yes stop_codon:yes gene_type:complete